MSSDFDQPDPRRVQARQLAEAALRRFEHLLLPDERAAALDMLIDHLLYSSAGREVLRSRLAVPEASAELAPVPDAAGAEAGAPHHPAPVSKK